MAFFVSKGTKRRFYHRRLSYSRAYQLAGRKNSLVRGESSPYKIRRYR